jgi:hypothetical protein
MKTQKDAYGFNEYLQHAEHNLDLARKDTAGAKDTWFAAARDYFTKCNTTQHARACDLAIRRTK